MPNLTHTNLYSRTSVAKNLYEKSVLKELVQAEGFAPLRLVWSRLLVETRLSSRTAWGNKT